MNTHRNTMDTEIMANYVLILRPFWIYHAQLPLLTGGEVGKVGSAAPLSRKPLGCK